MSGRFRCRALGALFLASALLCVPMAAGAASPDNDSSQQGSWNPISFLLHYLSSLLPGGSDDASEVTSSPKGSSSEGDSFSDGGGPGGTTDDDEGGETGPQIDPHGNP